MKKLSLKQIYQDLPQKQNPRLTRSFAHALAGIGLALTRERNLRIHTAVGAGALYAARYFALNRAEWMLLVLTVGFVLTCELINTSFEHIVDLASGLEQSALAKAAKDIAAGAVLVSSAASIAVGILLFWDPPALWSLWGRFSANPLPWVVALMVAFLWVRLPERWGKPLDEEKDGRAE